MFLTHGGYVFAMASVLVVGGAVVWAVGLSTGEMPLAVETPARFAAFGVWVAVFNPAFFEFPHYAHYAFWRAHYRNCA